MNAWTWQSCRNRKDFGEPGEPLPRRFTGNN